MFIEYTTLDHSKESVYITESIKWTIRMNDSDLQIQFINPTTHEIHVTITFQEKSEYDAAIKQIDTAFSRPMMIAG